MAGDKTIGLWSQYQPEPAKKAEWPGWETVNMIGRGSFGAVYEIRRDVFGEVEKAALKVISIPQNESDIEEMHNDGYDDESITATFQSYLQNIVAEYSLMRKMNGCVNIVQCEDIRYVQRSNGFGWDIFIKMELLTPLVKAVTLQVPDQVVVKVAKDICNALVACKEYDIVHRDIKPQNIFVSKYGDYKLGDFGIAKTVEKTSGGTKIGTYKYMAPEVFNNQPYGSAADIYSLGLVLYWLLNDRRMPFLPLPPAKIDVGMEESARYRRFRGEKLPPPARGSESLKRIVMKACAYDPKDRYASAADMLKDLNNVFADPVMLRKQEEEHRRREENARIEREKAAWEAKMRAEHETKIRAERESAQRAAMEKAERDRLRAEREDRDRTMLLDDDRTILIPEDKTETEKKKRTPVWVWIVGGVVLVAVILLLLFSCGREKEPEYIQPVYTTEPSTAPAEDATVTAATVNEENMEKILKEDYAAIGCYEASYSSTAVESGNITIPVNEIYDGLTVQVSNVDSGKSMEAVVEKGAVKVSDAAPGTYVVQLKTEDSPKLEWSEWGSKLPEGLTADSGKVQVDIMYRSAEKVFKESSKDTMEGWELYETKANTNPYGEWSKWSKEEVKASDTLEVEKKHQYRYRDRETTTSTSSAMDGWTKYDSSTTTTYGSWSSWTESEISSSSTVEVEKKTTYSYDAYIYHDGKHYETIIYTSSNGGFQAGELAEDYVYSDGDWKGVHRQVFIADAYFDKSVKYRSRSKSESTTYYFERFSAWSEWSSESVSSASNREIQERDMYRSREILGDTIYSFWSWGDWSKWSLKKPAESENVQAEYKFAYRYIP